jgi:tetratricopeptide (TPR) repeat protein
VTTYGYDHPNYHVHNIDEVVAKIEREPNHAPSRYEYGMTLLRHHRRSEAVVQFQIALALNPSHGHARQWLERTVKRLALEERVERLRTQAGSAVNPQHWAECAEALEAAGEWEEPRKLLEEYFRGPAANVTEHRQHETAPMRLLAWNLVQTLEPDHLARACELAHHAFRSEQHCPDDLAVCALVFEAAGRTREAANICEESLRLLQTPEMCDSKSATTCESILRSVLNRVTNSASNGSA